MDSSLYTPGAGEEILHRGEQQGQRRAELMADILEEFGLRGVQIGQRLRTAQLTLIRQGVSQNDPDLPTQHGEEIVEGGLIRSVRVIGADAGQP